MPNHNFQSSAPTYYYYTNYTSVPTKENDGTTMHGSRRVVTFCLLTTVLPTILIVLPLYFRNVKYADVMYSISDSDVIQIHKGQSSIFCEKHSLRMNTSFNAFQMKGRPEISDKRRHITLKKSMTLPDDTLEYWGFYLFKGATVELQACSRYDGSKILVVKGERILNTCGILDGDKYKKDPPVILNQGHVLVTLENPKSKKPVIIDDEKEIDFNDGKEDDWLDSSEVNSTVGNTTATNRKKRDTKDPAVHNPNTILDTGVNHGGNAFNTTDQLTPASVSSFEDNLFECYNGNILINEFFPYSMKCNSTEYLEKTTTLKVSHQVLEDGYYYYIFYSDNDIFRNDIHSIFDIYKPTFQYANMSESKVCINSTECEFNVGFFSDELVIVEVPTKDGLKNEDDMFILVSVCHPRVAVYIIFPISVLLLVLLFAFL